MKIVDMFGCGLPVCALDFKWYVPVLFQGTIALTKRSQSLSEVVRENRNGVKFTSSEELAQQLVQLLSGFPSAPRLKTLRDSFNRDMKILSRESSQSREDHEWGSWTENWNSVLLPHLSRDVDRNRSEGAY